MQDIQNALYFAPGVYDNTLNLFSDVKPDNLDFYDKSKDYPGYNFYTNRVPRVSNILKECIYDESLIDWFKYSNIQKINQTSNTALKVGTIVHEAIELYLKYNKNASDSYLNDTLTNTLYPTVKDQVYTAYNNFIEWHYRFTTELGYRISIIDIERPTINPWYGGTIDCIMNISNKNGYNCNYIIDFKTSKKITINYYLQTYAYLWSINWEMENTYYKTSIPKIDGIGIIRVDKNKKNNFEFSDIDFRDPDNWFLLSDLNKALYSMISWYYSKKALEYHFVLK